MSEFIAYKGVYGDKLKENSTYDLVGVIVLIFKLLITYRIIMGK